MSACVCGITLNVSWRRLALNGTRSRADYLAGQGKQSRTIDLDIDIGADAVDYK